MSLPRQISKFIGRHHVLTLATATPGGMPHCSNMFYAYMADENRFVFTSDHHTQHAAQALANPCAAASIVLETRVVGKLQGLQLRGRVYPLDGKQAADATKAYLKRFPYAAVAELHLWAFDPDWMKLTDNTLGFGKKLIWQKDE